jgi:hypothetical protein
MKSLAIALLTVLSAFTLACGGYGSSSQTAAPPSAGTTPTITLLAPGSTTHGDAAFVLTVTGTNFSTTAVINFGGTAETTNQVSSTQLTATIPATDIANAGTVAVTVTNPAVAGQGLYGGGGTLAETSPAMNFTVD